MDYQISRATIGYRNARDGQDTIGMHSSEVHLRYLAKVAVSKGNLYAASIVYKELNDKDNIKRLLYDAFIVYKELNDKDKIKRLEMLNPNIRIIEAPNDCHFHTKTKLRYINPKFLDLHGYARRVSEVYLEFIERLKEHKEKIERGNF